MGQILIGCGQITYGQFRESQPKTEEQILQEIAEAGYVGAMAGPRKDRTAKQTVELMERHGLKPAPGYMGADFWKADQKAKIVENARRMAAWHAQVGLSEMYVAANGFDYVTRSGLKRNQCAGHVSPEDGLSADEWKVFGDTITEACRATLAEGVKSCFHNHVGTPVEAPQEVERLLDMVDPKLLFLGPDTGHYAWGGGDVVAFFRKHARRIKTAHLKDIDKAVMLKGRQEKWDYGTFSRNGVFAEVGEGLIDFKVLLDILKSVDFSGWLLTETDVTQKPTAFESIKASRDHLKQLGV